MGESEFSATKEENKHVHLFNKYLLNSNYGINWHCSRPLNTTMNKTKKLPSGNLHSSEGKQTINNN